MVLYHRFRDYFSNRSIRTKMLIFILLITALEFAFVLFFISMVYRDNNIKINHVNNMNILKNISTQLDISRENINSFMLNVHSDSKFISGLIALTRDAPNHDELIIDTESIIRNYLRIYEDMAFVEVHIKGMPEIRISVISSSYHSIWNEFEDKYLQKTLNTPGEMIIFSPTNRKHLVFARAQPLCDGFSESNYYSLCIGLNQSHTTDILRRNTGGSSQQTILFTKDGQIISRSSYRLATNKVSELDIRYGDKQNSGKCTNAFGHWIYDLKYLDNIHMYASVLTEMSAIDLTGQSFMVSIRIILVAIIFLAMVIIYAMTSWINRPVRDLNHQFAEILRESKCRQLEISGSAELRSIATGINEVLNKQEVLIWENYRIKILEKNARIELLQVQINPHFVFNTLDIINWLIFENNNKDASRIVVILGEMLRYSTYRYTCFVTLEEEINHIRNYLYIQLLRYDNQFCVDIDVEKSLNCYKIPCLTIQPVVENAVKYGATCKDVGGRIAITAFKHEQTLIINVFDNGPGMTKEQIKKALFNSEVTNVEGNEDSGIGLRNVNERMKLIFGQQYAVTIDSDLGYFTQVTIRLPLRENIDESYNC